MKNKKSLTILFLLLMFAFALYSNIRPANQENKVVNPESHSPELGSSSVYDYKLLETSKVVSFCGQQYETTNSIEIKGIDIVKRVSEIANAEMGRDEEFPFCEIIQNIASRDALEVSIVQQDINSGFFTISIAGNLIDVDVESNTIFRSYIDGFIPWGKLIE